ncbi:MAG: nucleotidyltransferase family protein [Clostridia bacterium]|nr:nucleotidyltransferase family protein [Clostridia bacterium]
MDDRLKSQTIRHLQHLSVINKLDVVFKNNNIQYFILKGLNLAYVYWSDPYTRPLGDIDIFVHKEDKNRAILLLKSAYNNMEIGEEFFKNKPLYRYNEKLVLDGVTIELHWDLSPYCKYQINISSFFNNIQYFSIAGNDYPGLNPTYLLLALTIHAGKSYFWDLTEKQYTDLLLVLTKGKINFDLFYLELKSTGSINTAKIIFYLLKERKNFLLPTGILPDISQSKKFLLKKFLSKKTCKLSILSSFKRLLLWLLLVDNKSQIFRSIKLYLHSM